MIIPDCCPQKILQIFNKGYSYATVSVAGQSVSLSASHYEQTKQQTNSQTPLRGKQPMFTFLPLGTLLNALTVLIGGTLGTWLGHRFPQRMQETIFASLGLFTLFIGLS
ncbi:MAG: DUF554 family protein, partial [Anaerolineales bacterium]|nr:DUF554 family protein [Anaerolineales bacterium]